MIYPQIESVLGDYPVQRVCQLLGVAPSGYYRYRQHQLSRHAREDGALLVEIRRIFVESHETYGSPRIHAALQQAGRRVARKRVERLMHEHAIMPHRAKRQRSHTKRDPDHRTTPNLLGQHFVASRPNQIWLTDTTELNSLEGIRYLATVEDLFSRRIVGWTTASRFTKETVSIALRNALAQRRIRPGSALALLHHSDRGSQYTSNDYLDLLEDYGLQSSMSDQGNCYDNAPMESFFATLKGEWTTIRIFPTHAALDNDLFDFIECFYNRIRLHSALGYRSPVAFEAAFYAQSTLPIPPKEDPLSPSFHEAVAFCPLE